MLKAFDICIFVCFCLRNLVPRIPLSWWHPGEEAGPQWGPDGGEEKAGRHPDLSQKQQRV